jgi:threonine dehydratase
MTRSDTAANDRAIGSDILAMIHEAESRIRGFVLETPVVQVQESVPKAGTLFLKLEQLQKTGSFKLRGATNKVMSLSEPAALAGVVTSSTGNHGLGVAAAAKHRRIDAEVFVSAQVPLSKLERMQEFGARIRKVGNTPLESELAARSAAAESGRAYVSPYNDPLVVAGQGTIGIELKRQIPQFDAVYVAAGGGGLISGIGSYLKNVSPQVEIIGCWPENSCVLYECLKAGRVIAHPESYTVSESTAGGVEEASITLPLAQKVVNRGVLVTENEILNAMAWAHSRGWEIEGAAGVALAAFFKESAEQRGKSVVVLFCGGNISPGVRKRLL